MSETGDVVGPLRVGTVAGGGHCVTRLDGRVVFVRHALPGELVRVELTDTARKRAWRGDAVEILEPSPDRVAPPCPVARPGGCGGCDFQHASRPAQLALKTTAVADQLRRIGDIEWTGAVEDCGYDFGWRTRMRYIRDEAGRLGLRAQRSNDVITLPETGCLIAHPRTHLDPLPEIAQPGRPGEEMIVAGGADGPTVTTRDGVVGPDPVVEQAIGRAFAMAPTGFWQVHPSAPAILTEAVLAGLAPHPGERAWDLYCGAGLFAGALVDASCTVAGVEGNKEAVELARRNVPQARFHAGDVQRTLRKLPAAVDVVVLDPPRTGAGPELIRQVLAFGPRAVAYVSCDPATLARDLRAALDEGAELTTLRAFDLFPQTHHVECVAILTQPSVLLERRSARG